MEESTQVSAIKRKNSAFRTKVAPIILLGLLALAFIPQPAGADHGRPGRCEPTSEFHYGFPPSLSNTYVVYGWHCTEWVYPVS